MPVHEEDEFLQGDVPDGPHIVMVTKIEGGHIQGIPMPVGSRQYFVFDPEDATQVIPVLLVKFNRYGISWRCNCGQAKCTRVFKAKLTVSGHHP